MSDRDVRVDWRCKRLCWLVHPDNPCADAVIDRHVDSLAQLGRDATSADGHVYRQLLERYPTATVMGLNACLMVPTPSGLVHVNVDVPEDTQHVADLVSLVFDRWKVLTSRQVAGEVVAAVRSLRTYRPYVWHADGNSEEAADADTDRP